MRLFYTVLLSLLSLGFFHGIYAPQCSAEEPADTPLAPYFFVPSADSAIEQLPLTHTSAEVEIAGVIAEVTITQVYQNRGRAPIEATYVFPGSTNAALHGLTLTIGERQIVAKVDERSRAQTTFESARQEGKTAALLEQQRPNVFQMHVTNILPGEEISSVVRYTELLVPTAGVYRFVYPTVVGPRYSGHALHKASPHARWVTNPYLTADEKPPYTFGLTLALHGGMPIQELRSPSHQVSVSYEDKDRAQITLAPGEEHGGNRDFILEYRLSGAQIHSGLLLNEGAKENFFLLMMQPPKHTARSKTLPKEYIFVVDVSGSMHGFPLQTAKELIRTLVRGLSPEDLFNLSLFSGGSALLSPSSLPPTEGNIRRALALLESSSGGGSTELFPALEEVFSIRRPEGRSRTVIVITDGDISAEAEVFDLVRSQLHSANVFAFGIGSSVNRHLIEGIAHAGAGEPFVVLKPADAETSAARFWEYVRAPVLTNIEVSFNGIDAYDVEPKSVPDVFAERPVIIYGKFRGTPSGSARLRGTSPAGPYSQELAFESAHKDNAALPYLWARKRIETLSDYHALSTNDEQVKEVTSLGLTYNLLTAFTSFVAVDSEARTQSTTPVVAPVVVSQPLPLPEGVSNYAVGGGGSGPSAAFSEAAFEDRRVAHSVPRLLILIEGSVGAAVLVLCAALGIVFLGLTYFNRRHWRKSAFCFSCAGAVFLIRSVAWVLFAPDGF